MKEIYIIVLIYNVCNVICSPLNPVEVLENVENDGSALMNAVVYKTVNKYQCYIDNISGINLIMYGTNAWTFPEQDVNLTLRYPNANKDNFSEFQDFLITGFKVVLSFDGEDSNGFITNGGILQDSIMLTFTSSQITILRYQFWVYGVHAKTQSSNDFEPLKYVNMCQ